MQQGLTRLIGRIRNRCCTGSELVVIVRASLIFLFQTKYARVCSREVLYQHECLLP